MCSSETIFRETKSLGKYIILQEMGWFFAICYSLLRAIDYLNLVNVVLTRQLSEYCFVEALSLNNDC